MASVASGQPGSVWSRRCPNNLTVDEALNLLKLPSDEDASIHLAQATIAALLKIHQGADGSQIEKVIQPARKFLCDNPIGSNPKGKAMEKAVKLQLQLEKFNNGELNMPACPKERNLSMKVRHISEPSKLLFPPVC